MANARELTLRLVSDASQFGRGFGQAERQASNFSRNIARAFGASGKDIDSRAKAMDASLRSVGTAFVGIAAAGTAAVLAARKFVGFAIDAKNSFSELNESANAASVVFGDAFVVIENFGKTAADSVGLARSEFTQLAAVVGSQLQNFGFSARDAAKETIALTERASDMASVFNTSVPDALNAISSALRGETEPIRRYAVSLNDAAIRAEAVSLGLAKTAASADANAKAQAAMSIIYAQTDAVAGDFLNTSDQLANRERILASRFEDTKAALGEQLVPAFESLLDVAENTIPVIEELGPLFNQLGLAIADVADNSQGPIVTLLEFLADAPRSVGIITSAFETLGETLNGIFITSNFDAAGEALDNLGRARIEQGLVDGVRDGRDEVEVFTNALFMLSQQQAITSGDIERFGRLAGLSDFEVGRGVTTLLNAFDAGDIDLDRQALVNLNRALTEIRDNLENADPTTIEDIRFGNLRQQAAQAGEEIAGGFEDAQKIAQKAADNLASAIESSAAKFSGAISLFAEAPAELEQINLDESLGNIEEQIARLGRFNEALGALSGAGLDSLVADLAAQGPAVVLTAEALAGDIGAAFDLERALEEGNRGALDAAVTAVTGQREKYRSDLEALGEFFASDLENGFASLNLTSYVAQAIRDVRTTVGGFSSGGGGSAAVTAGARAYGGAVDAGRSYVVGENQPEVFTPMVAGRISPDLGSSSTTLSISQTVNNPTTHDLGRDLDLQRNLILSTVGRMIES